MHKPTFDANRNPQKLVICNESVHWLHIHHGSRRRASALPRPPLLGLLGRTRRRRRRCASHRTEITATPHNKLGSLAGNRSICLGCDCDRTRHPLRCPIPTPTTNLLSQTLRWRLERWKTDREEESHFHGLGWDGPHKSIFDEILQTVSDGSADR